MEARGGQRVTLIFCGCLQRRGVIVDVDRDGQGAIIRWDDSQQRLEWWDTKYLTLTREDDDGKTGYA